MGEDLRITKKQLKEKVAELINVQTTRKREKYAFDTAVGVYNIIHPAIGEALEYLEALFAGEESFLQLSRHVNKMLVSAVQLGAEPTFVTTPKALVIVHWNCGLLPALPS